MLYLGSVKNISSMIYHTLGLALLILFIHVHQQHKNKISKYKTNFSHTFFTQNHAESKISVKIMDKSTYLIVYLDLLKSGAQKQP